MSSLNECQPLTITALVSILSSELNFIQCWHQSCNHSIWSSLCVITHDICAKGSGPIAQRYVPQKTTNAASLLASYTTRTQAPVCGHVDSSPGVAENVQDHRPRESNVQGNDRYAQRPSIERLGGVKTWYQYTVLYPGQENDEMSLPFVLVLKSGNEVGKVKWFQIGWDVMAVYSLPRSYIKIKHIVNHINIFKA